jgi:phospholipid/cholesterol/gamma-HCH transport system substrate-binding protein
MMALRRRLLAPAVAAVAAGLLLFLVTRGGDDHLRLRVQLAEATGLREGTVVRADGGAEVGEIGRLSLGRHDEVLADLELDPDKVRVGKDASVRLTTQNLLGESTITLNTGDARKDPAPDGYVIPASRVGTNVQLDQVVDVLDSGTRARLAVLVNEAGRALTGRGLDLNDLLEQLPPSLDASTALLDALSGETRRIGAAVTQGDQFVHALTKERSELKAMIRTTGQTMTTVAGRQADLRATLAKAPTTLRTLQRFLADLESTTRPLGPAADALADAGPPLKDTLAAVEPFRKVADPVLREAKQVSPSLSDLARGATPVIERARPSLAATAKLLESSSPLTQAVDASIDDLVGFMEGWARAIQARDGISHVFRGRALVGQDAVRALLASLGQPGAEKTKTKTAKVSKTPPTQPAPAAAAAPAPRPPASDAKPAPQPPKLQSIVPKLADTVGDVVSTLVGGGKSPKQPEDHGGVSGLLDFLLKP